VSNEEKDMRRHLITAIGLALVAAAASVSLVGQDQQANSTAATGWAQKTPWGDPDLQGIWVNENTGTPMERPTQYEGREFLTTTEIEERQKAAMDRYEKALAAYNPSGPRSTGDIERTKKTVEAGIYGAEYNNVWMEAPRKPGPIRWKRTSLVVDPPDGRIPVYTMELLNRLEAREEARKHRGEADTWEDRNLNERCMSPQASTGLQGSFRLVQAPGWVVILHDGLEHPRIVPLDGRPKPSPKIRGWFGRSRGRWDGDKLVVEITNYNDKQDGGPVLPSRRPLGFYLGSGDTLRRVETYRRVGPDQLEFGLTTDDPSVYVKPFTVLRPMILNNDYMMLPGACHEGNYGMTNIMAAGRADEKYALRAALEAAEERKPQIAALKKETEEFLKTGKRSPPRGPGAAVDQ
jgi:hypothetical protein